MAMVMNCVHVVDDKRNVSLWQRVAEQGEWYPRRVGFFSLVHAPLRRPYNIDNHGAWGEDTRKTSNFKAFLESTPNVVVFVHSFYRNLDSSQSRRYR